MKASFFCTNSYASPEPFRHVGWPVPPGLYRSEVGKRSINISFSRLREREKMCDSPKVLLQKHWERMKLGGNDEQRNAESRRIHCGIH